MTIPVFVPKLPTAEDLLPYLREIDLARTYSNFGPMVLRLHSELAQYFGVRVDQIVTLANATLALEGAIQTSSNKETHNLLNNDNTPHYSNESIESEHQGLYI